MILKNDVTIIAQKLYPRIFTDTTRLEILQQEKLSIGEACADQLCRSWQKEVQEINPGRFIAEATSGGSGPIDLLDTIEGIAYELKYSHKNVKHEFYKDLFKVLVYNESSGKKIKHFVFLCHHKGISSLTRSSLCQSTVQYMLGRGIEVSLVELYPEEIFSETA